MKVKRLPKPLITYLFCSPSLDGNLRCLPREGGYYDQDYIDILNFQIIERRIVDWQRRQEKKTPKPKQTKGRVSIPLKDLDKYE